MNIFKVLANGDGQITEPNISAFLGYLLDPYGDHGLSFEFLERFLREFQIVDENFNTRHYDFEIIFEQAFKMVDKKKEIVDIVIIVFDKEIKKGENYVSKIISSERKVKQIFLIENKIRKGLSYDQLINQYNASVSVLSKIIINGTIEDIISAVYITPNDQKFITEFNKYNNSFPSFHIFWKANNEDEISISHLLKGIIRDERNSKIDVINSTTLDIIKSFITFIESDFKSEKEERREKSHDGSYTKRYIELNERSQIKTKLNNLVDNISTIDPVLASKLIVDVSSARWPKIKIPIGDIFLEIFAGSEYRDRIYFVYRLNPQLQTKSKVKLAELADEMKVEVKIPNGRESYCRNMDMSQITLIEDYKHVHSRLIKFIDMAK